MDPNLCYIVRGDGESNSSAFSSEVRSKVYAPARFAKAFYHLILSETRVMIFVWALLTSYLIAADLHPELFRLTLLLASGYMLTLGVYVLNALMDIESDKINSPSRPLASGLVSVEDAKMVFFICVASSLVVSYFISFTTVVLFAISLFLGISYSMPRVQAKKRFPGKLLVTACGAAVFSLTGGVAAQDLNPTIFFAAVAFALFALVTLLLGDIADMKGDLALQVRSLPMVIGARRAIIFVTALPLILSALGLVLFRFTNFNPLFPIMLIAVSCYSSFTITSLLRDYDPKTCRMIKSKMRIMHFVLQLTFILGLLPL